MFTLSIVERFDVLEDVLPGLMARGVTFAMHPLGLQFSEEAFGRRVVVAVAASAHATDDAMIVKQLPEVARGILAAAIAVMHQPGRGAPLIETDARKFQQVVFNLLSNAVKFTADPEGDGRLDHFANAEVIEFENAGHWLHHDQFDHFMATLRDFL